ncbi:hypothetical protein [Nitratireductor sp. CH_MIT9313-5]|uniref:hypothetical protein n=1 Tax=Nitratireductor sp. CH_MIT9313-5 TaxID=3107764 RepID=UPI0030088EB0
MIQNILVFALGFLAAALLAVLVAPALWRRAGELARKRLEAQLPLSRDELNAAIDAQRAEQAMAVRRLEMQVEAQKKKAASDLVTINQQKVELTEAGEREAALAENLAQRESELSQTQEKLSASEAEAASFKLRLEQADAKIQEQAREIENLSGSYEEASLKLSRLELDIVSRDSDIERLKKSVAVLRDERKQARADLREASSRRKQVENALKLAEKRAKDLERRNERMMSQASTREEALERKQREITLLKTRLRENNMADDGGATKMAALQEENARLEAKAADLSLQISSLLADGAEPSGANPAEDRLKTRLAAVVEENRRLRAALTESQGTDNDAELREQIAALAAEVVTITAALEGPDSPIISAIESEAAQDPQAATTSLADRVKALRRATAPAE